MCMSVFNMNNYLIKNTLLFFSFSLFLCQEFCGFEQNEYLAV